MKRLGLTSKHKSGLVESNFLCNKKTKPDDSLSENDNVNSLENPTLGLPDFVIKGLQATGIQILHDWQRECLLLPGVLDSNKNLLFSSPTSAGKTLVAEIIVLKRIVETQKRAIIVLPFISIVNELKAKWVSRYAEYGLNIASYFGSSNGPVFEEVDIAICTIEKANSLINRLLEEGKMELLSTLVIDEIHLIGNDNRGYLLELMLTKIRALSLQIKVVGMSATLPDIDVISNWLNSTLYISKYRPIPIAEYIKVKDSILSKFGTEVRKISMDAKEAKKRGDHDMLVPIVQEVVVKGNSVIVFCSKKNDCENTAKLLSRLMTIDYDDSFKDKLIHARKLLVEEMRYADGGLDGQLANIIFNGVAYHHSGLTSEERSLIENGFRSGCISVICATSTLASGVNLPCARVIFRSPYIGKKFLDNLDYQQMKGRSGRFGLDDAGESIIMCQSNELSRVLDLVTIEKGNISSCLGNSKLGMHRAMLESVYGGMVCNQAELISNVFIDQGYIESTLFFHQFGSKTSTVEVANVSLQFLLDHHFISKSGASEELKLTALGAGTVASSLDPEEATFINRELQKSLRNICLLDDLHIIYNITPISKFGGYYNWETFCDIYHNLNDIHYQVANLVGIQIGFLTKLSQGFTPSSKEQDKYQIHVRFFHCLLLFDIIHGIPLEKLVKKYAMDRGAIQAIQSLSSTYAVMIKIFCQKLKYSFFELLITKIQEQLVFGVEAEILHLAKIEKIDRKTARILYEGGFKTPKDVANASVIDVFQILQSHFPDSIDSMIFKQSRLLVQNAKNFV